MGPSFQSQDQYLSAYEHEDQSLSPHQYQTSPLIRVSSSEGVWSSHPSPIQTTTMSEPTYSTQGWPTSPEYLYTPSGDSYHGSPDSGSPVAARPRSASTGEGHDSSGKSHGDYCCLYPDCTAKPFRRNADLDRHYRNRHGDPSQKDTFFCDYSKCQRRTEPFHRLDHFRDHLRQFHKEEIQKRGVFGGEEQAAGGSGSKGKRWWRCPRCLTRWDVGMDCTKCAGDGRAKEGRRR